MSQNQETKSEKVSENVRLTRVCRRLKHHKMCRARIKWNPVIASLQILLAVTIGYGAHATSRTEGKVVLSTLSGCLIALATMNVCERRDAIRRKRISEQKIDALRSAPVLNREKE